MSELWFKVIKNGESCSGGSHKWSLPQDGPGDWHSLPEGTTPELCCRGFHLTKKPVFWFSAGCDIYIAEGRGATAGPAPGEDSTKVAFSECRLLRKATVEEMAVVGVFVSGSHTVSEGRCVASGSSKVTAYGSSKVTAYDSSQVTAYDSSQVTAYGSSKVTAKNSVTVIVTQYATTKPELSDSAAEVSWASGRPEFRRASDPPK